MIEDWIVYGWGWVAYIFCNIMGREENEFMKRGRINNYGQINCR